MHAAHFLVDAVCATPHRLRYACQRFAADPAVAASVIGTLAYVVIYESTDPLTLHDGPTVLEVRSHVDNQVMPIDDVEEYTRATARIVACLAGGDLDTAMAVVAPYSDDPDRATRLLMVLARYAHAAAHHTGPPVVTLGHVDAQLVDVPDHL
jgi:acyl-CoA synthetase (NDP forming)